MPRLQSLSSDKFVAGVPQLKLIEDFRKLSETSETTGDIGTEYIYQFTFKMF